MMTVIAVLVGAILVLALFGICWALVATWHAAESKPTLRAVVFFAGLALVSVLITLAPALYYVLFILIAQLVG